VCSSDLAQNRILKGAVRAVRRNQLINFFSRVRIDLHDVVSATSTDKIDVVDLLNGTHILGKVWRIGDVQAFIVQDLFVRLRKLEFQNPLVGSKVNVSIVKDQQGVMVLKEGRMMLSQELLIFGNGEIAIPTPQSPYQLSRMAVDFQYL